VAINNSRIVSVDDQSVTYKIRRSKSNKMETKRVDGEVFVGNFLQHVLPCGFKKIRQYGWMSANSKVSLDEVKWLVWLFLGWTYWLASGYAPQEKPLTTPLRCKVCGGTLRVVEVTFASLQSRGIVPTGSLGYYDSG
jgi:Putative transposase